jgi:hypothetical protein
LAVLQHERKARRDEEDFLHNKQEQP